MDSCLKKCFTKNKYTDPHLRSVFKPLYIILSVLGLFPYSVQLHVRKNGFLTIPKSIYLNLICAVSNIIVFVSFLVLHIRQIYYSIESSSLTEGIMTQMNYITELCALIIFCMVTYISVYLNRFRYVKILNMLSALIDAPNIDNEKILNRLRFQVNIVVGGSLSVLLIMQIVVNFSRSDSIFKMFLVVFTFIMPQMVQFTTIFFFYLLIIMIVEVFRNVRENILSSSEKSAINGFMKVGSRQGELTLRQIELIYIEAFSIKQSINQIFEAPILVTMMQCFHAIVSESHIIYHGIVVQRNLEIHEIVNCAIWIVYQVIKIFAIANAGNLFKLEAMKLGRSIHSIPTDKQDLRFFMEVQHLSALMSLTEKELTVYGYFPLDAALMFKVYTLSWSRVDWSTWSYRLCEAGAALFATTLTSFSSIGMSISTLGRQTTFGLSR